MIYYVEIKSVMCIVRLAIFSFKINNIFKGSYYNI